VPKATIKPTATLPDYKRVDRTGGSTQFGVLSDSNDATYIRRKADKAPLARYVLATPTIPAGSDIATIVPGARLKQPTSVAPKMVTLAMSVPGTGKPVNKIAPTLNGPTVRAGSGTVAYTYATPAGAGKTAGPSGPWADVLSKLAIRVNDGHKASDANRATIYELYADVYYAARPTASLAISPASPVTTTSYPEITATLAALIEDWQDNSGAPARTELAYELKVFTDAQYGAGGFNPATSPCVWSTQGLTAPLDYTDGSTPSTEDVAETPDVALPNGAYRAYARGRRNFDAAQFGDWAYLAFTQAVTPTPSPTLTAAKDDATQRVTIVATPNSGAGASAPTLTIERSDDGGATWEPVRGATREPCTFGVDVTTYDYEAKRAVAVSYRANVESLFSSLLLVSNWATAAVTGTIACGDWNLKCPLDPSLNMLDVAVNADPEWTQDEEAATFRPVGRKFPVVVSMSMGGADGSLTISARTDAEWADVEALRDYQGTLLLESPYGWSRYIRILSRGWTETGAASAARRRLSCSYLEVEGP
jgi:hypothetical protein